MGDEKKRHISGAEASQDQLQVTQQGTQICYALNSMETSGKIFTYGSPPCLNFHCHGIPMCIMSPYLSLFPSSHPVSQSTLLTGGKGRIQWTVQVRSDEDVHTCMHVK